METGLKGRLAVVAASSQGIGLATAQAFAAEGANLAMCARSETNLRSAAHAIMNKWQVQVFYRTLDVTDSEGVRQFVAEAATKFRRIDVCVTNAGGPPAKGFLATTPEDWNSAVSLNLLSVVNFAREVIPHMQRQKWGRLITITSVAVKQPVADLVLSNAVRAAVAGLVKSLANEFGKDGILVNNVGPGYTATERLKSLAAARAKSTGLSEEKISNTWGKDTPVQRLGRPEEIAETIVWLASERASFITGQTVLADGGLYKGL
jgi:3-oxoacyl-[acyl-carrier protein] reductase